MRNWARDLVNPIPAARREHPAVAGATVLALLALAVYCGVTRHIPLLSSPSGTTVRAEFAQANFVNDQTPVRVGGVDVGYVSAVRLDSRRDLAVVTMRLSNPQVAVKRDALAAIRWRTMLGGTFFIDLDPGSPSAQPLGDATIPASHTSNQVEFDDLDQVFAGRTADGPRVFLREMRSALADPPGFDRALSALTTMTPTIAGGAAAIRGQDSDDLRHLVAGSAATVAALGHDTSALQGLVIGMQGTLDVTDRERNALGRTIDLSPGALDSTSTTMRDVAQTLDHLDPLVASLRPGARELAPATAAATPALQALQALLADAKPLLAPLGGALASLASAGRAGVPLMQRLTPTLTRLRTGIDPWLASRDAATGMRTYAAIGPTLAAIDSGASEFDGEGYWLHFPSQADTRTVVLGLPGGSGTAPAASMCSQRGVSAVRCAALIVALQQIFGPGARR
jgi:ABC-type transporter Mla subunit MlaD